MVASCTTEPISRAMDQFIEAPLLACAKHIDDIEELVKQRYAPRSLQRDRMYAVTYE
jgi:hypothetical protein